MSLTTALRRRTETETETAAPEPPAPAPVCGAQDGHGNTCTLDPHPEGTRHLDAAAGSMYHSVTWR